MIKTVKYFLFREDNTPLDTINIYQYVWFLVFCIELIRKGEIASHIQVIESFNLRNSIKWSCNVGNRKIFFYCFICRKPRMLESLAGCHTMFLVAVFCKIGALERNAY